MTQQPEPSASNITILPGGLEVKPPGTVRGTHINVQDYYVLMEGAGTARDASVRDVCIGIGSTGLTTSIGLMLSTPLVQFVDVGDGRTLSDVKWGPLACVLLLGAATIAATVIAFIAHKRTKGDPGRRSFAILLERLRSDLGVPPDDGK